MIEEKIAKYRNAIIQAEEIQKNHCINHEYYDQLIVRFEKMLEFYEKLGKNQMRKRNTSYPLINSK